MGKEYFVTKFMSGKGDASSKMRWWLRHGVCCSTYLQDWYTNRDLKGKAGAEALRLASSKSCGEWNVLVGIGEKNKLMAEHAALELATVDVALSEKFDRGNLFSIAEFMTENVVKQAKYFAREIPDFPENRFKELMLEHVKLFLELVRWYSTPDDRKYFTCEERRLENTLALAAFSTEWF